MKQIEVCEGEMMTVCMTFNFKDFDRLQYVVFVSISVTSSSFVSILRISSPLFSIFQLRAAYRGSDLHALMKLFFGVEWIKGVNSCIQMQFQGSRP